MQKYYFERIIVRCINNNALFYYLNDLFIYIDKEYSVQVLLYPIPYFSFV